MMDCKIGVVFLNFEFGMVKIVLLIYECVLDVNFNCEMDCFVFVDVIFV